MGPSLALLMSQQETYLQVRVSLPSSSLLCYLSFTFTETPAQTLLLVPLVSTWPSQLEL